MKRLMIVLLLAVFAGGCASQNCCEEDGMASMGVVRHVVMFRFKEGTSPEKVREIERAFAALPGRIPQIMDFEWGTNVSPEDHAQGYTHCFLVTFKNEADRDAYLPHPAHGEFVELLLPNLDEAHVIDYIARR